MTPKKKYRPLDAMVYPTSLIAQLSPCMAASTSLSAMRLSLGWPVFGSFSLRARDKASRNFLCFGLPPGLPDLPFWNAIVLNEFSQLNQVSCKLTCRLFSIDFPAFAPQHAQRPDPEANQRQRPRLRAASATVLRPRGWYYNTSYWDQCNQRSQYLVFEAADLTPMNMDQV